MSRYTTTALKRLEAAQKDAERVPADLFGKYYDELSTGDKVRFMRYAYPGVDIDRAEHIEKNLVQHGTLHFICQPNAADDPCWKELDRKIEDWTLALDRLPVRG